MTHIKIGDRVISQSSAPYVIAEIGVNHEGSLDKARELIELAHEGGADAAKFQSYKAEALAAKHSPAYWDRTKEPTASQYELFKKFDHFGEKDYITLAGHCRKTGIDFISTPFDDQAVNFLYPLVPFYKIASADITYIPFLRKIAKQGKPVILSTGASRLGEIDLALEELRLHGCEQVALLHCILNYPTDYEHANLGMISGLQRAYPELVIGYSDHTLPDPDMLILTAAYLKGARIIEKHFTYNKNLKGNDHYHAMDVGDLKKFKNNLSFLQKIKGVTHKAPLPSESLSRKNARRSICLKRPVAEGTRLTEDVLTCKRPAIGISPTYWDEVIGRQVVKNLPEDHLLRWEDLTD